MLETMGVLKLPKVANLSTKRTQNLQQTTVSYFQGNDCGTSEIMPGAKIYNDNPNNIYSYFHYSCPDHITMSITSRTLIWEKIRKTNGWGSLDWSNLLNKWTLHKSGRAQIIERLSALEQLNQG